ncbi:Protein of unknown function [Propionibacterium freudenreichii subsp. freudenreichii]|uniref:Uncharacterized protein n=1 Tax=Propionibacterium freudenreichii subsp. freudenreichii TaxID=66712 RepID=A0A0B7NYC4_PROFF|nr:Protein of unknown function [Propionibacterium freudenreichii subsp. freudenreichii]
MTPLKVRIMMSRFRRAYSCAQ